MEKLYTSLFQLKKENNKSHFYSSKYFPSYRSSKELYIIYIIAYYVIS